MYYEILDTSVRLAGSLHLLPASNPQIPPWVWDAYQWSEVSERMWTAYAQNHEGIVLRIQPNDAKDSKFRLFEPVQYRAARPPLYNDTLGFLEESLFGHQMG